MFHSDDSEQCGCVGGRKILWVPGASSVLEYECNSEKSDSSAELYISNENTPKDLQREKVLL